MSDYLAHLRALQTAAKKRLQRARRAADEALREWRRHHSAAGLLAFERAAEKQQIEARSVVAIERLMAEARGVDIGTVSLGEASQ